MGNPKKGKEEDAKRMRKGQTKKRGEKGAEEERRMGEEEEADKESDPATGDEARVRLCAPG